MGREAGREAADGHRVPLEMTALNVAAGAVGVWIHHQVKHDGAIGACRQRCSLLGIELGDTPEEISSD